MFTDRIFLVDDPPENLDDLFDDLEYPDTATTLFSRISSRDAAWLAVHTKKSLEGLRERMYEDLHKELNVCYRHSSASLLPDVILLGPLPPSKHTFLPRFADAGRSHQSPAREPRCKGDSMGCAEPYCGRG